MTAQSDQCNETADNLSAESVEGLSLALEGVDNVHGSDSLTASVLSVGDRVTDDVLEEDLEHTTGLLVDETGDTLDTATTSETTDSGLGDALDVIAKDLAVTLGASLSKSLASFSSSRHDELVGDSGCDDDEQTRFIYETRKTSCQRDIEH